MATRTPLDELAQHVFVACVGVSRRARFDESSLLPPHQFNALAWIEDGVTSAGAIAQHERVSAPSMSRTVACLEERGMLTRQEDPEDGRRLILALTDTGRAALAEVRAERNTWMSERLKTCTAQERDLLQEASAVLRRMVQE